MDTGDSFRSRSHGVTVAGVAQIIWVVIAEDARKDVRKSGQSLRKFGESVRAKKRPGSRTVRKPGS